MTPCELPAAPPFPNHRDSPPTPTSSSQNAPQLRRGQGLDACVTMPMTI
jgi:hypothetical protein